VGELRVKADLRAMDQIRAFLRDSLRGIDLAEEDYFKIELSLHEIAVNIILHAYPAEKGDLVLRTWFEGGKAFFEFRDTGISFDPRQAAPPDILEKLRTGMRGGFGIYLSKTLMDGFEYKREFGQNVLTVFKTLSSAADSV
jgi:anti-sigma regulatory factor (Ser/Thr protein kinase)